MPLQGQDLLNLCALAAENEDLIVSVGKLALNFALSPNRAAFDIARGLAGIVFTGLAANSAGQRLGTGTPRKNGRKVPAGDYIKNEMNAEQQQRLINRVSNVLGNKNRSSFTDLLSMILNNPNIRNRVVSEIKKFLEGENMTCCRDNNCGYDDDEEDDVYYDAPCCSRTRSCSRY